MSEQLKRCPFCGAPGQIGRSGERGMVHVGCMEDDPDICLYHPMIITTEGDIPNAIAAWNRRAASGPAALQGVPVDVANTLRMALLSARIDYSPIGKSKDNRAIDNALIWLDAQAQEEEGDGGKWQAG